MTNLEVKILNEVAAGRVVMICGCALGITEDGGYSPRYCCDQTVGWRLVTDGLIRPLAEGLVGEWTPAVLTDKGRAELGEAP